MGTEDTVVVELFSVETIAFYVWVLGVATACIWKEIETVDWFKLSFKFFGYMILAMVIAITIANWFGLRSFIVLAVIFVTHYIVRAYRNIRYWLRSNNNDNEIMRPSRQKDMFESLSLQRRYMEMNEEKKQRLRGLKFAGYIFMPDENCDFDDLREFSTNLGQGTLTIFDESGKNMSGEIFFDNSGQMLKLILDEYKKRVRCRVPTARQREKSAE